MPSGFQLDNNQLTPSYYRVTIQCGEGSATWYAVDDGGSDESEGRISALSWDNFEGNSRPETQREANALARGNLRFQAIVESLSNLADCQILDIEMDASGGNMHNNIWINFTVKFDRDEGVFPALAAIKKAEDFGTDGTTTYDNVEYPRYYAYVDNGDTIGNTEDAIRDVIWNALKVGRTRSMRVFQPIEGTDPLEGSGIQAVITAATPWDNDSNAWNDIGVNYIGDTETNISYD